MMHNYGRAVARSSDPTTSWDAARKVGNNLTQLQDNVLEVLKRLDVATDEQIHEYYEHYFDVKVSESTTRTRRKELQNKGLVFVFDKKGLTKGGNKCQRFCMTAFGAIDHLLEHAEISESEQTAAELIFAACEQPTPRELKRAEWVLEGIKQGYLDEDRGILFLTGAAGPSHEDHLDEDGNWKQ